MLQRPPWLARGAATVLLIACWGCDAGDDAPPSPRDGAVTDDAGSAGTGAGSPDASSTEDAGDPETDAGGAASPDAGEVTDAGGAGGDASVDHDSPQLVDSTPQDGDDNVASDAVFVLAFSEPIVFDPGAIRVRQQSPPRTLDFTATTGADGSELELTLDETPDVPAELTIALSDGITDLAGNPLEPTELHLTVPVWLRLGAAANREPSAAATDVRLTLDAEGRPLLLSVEDGHVYACRWRNDGWQALGAALDSAGTLASPGAEARLALALDGDGAPVAAFRESTGVSVVRWDGNAWQALGDAPDPEGGGSYAPALALDESGELVVAFDALDASSAPVLRVRALSGASWQTLADLAVDARGVRLAGAGDEPFTLAYQDASTGLTVLRWSGSALQPLGAGPELASVTGSFALSVAGNQDVALTAQGRGSVSWDSAVWSALPQDLGFNDSSTALDRALTHAPDGALLAAFSERPLGESAARVYVQRLEDTRFQPLGSPLNRDRQADAADPALAVDARGEALVAWLETPSNGGPAQVFASRYNGDPTLPPAGLRERAYDASCLATAPADGSLLTDTECFSDALGRIPVAGFVPFDVRSALWSDGAFKRRFFMLPEGETITYRDPGIWTLPEGSILIKEFAIEAKRGDPSTIRPVETRFLVVHESAVWDRYSFQWNQAATEAVLRPAAPATPLVEFEIEDEGGAPAVQTHYNPSRAQCFSCHQTPGTVLGLQAAMINRNFDYGTTVDNQLRAMQRLGLFGSTFEAADLGIARTMPNPIDTTYPTEARLRAYLHANCSSCHHPLQGMDLRIQTATLDSGLCTKISKGSLDSSTIYWRDVLRGYPGQPGVAPMPPLGTLVANPALEPLLTDWILDPQNPCP